MKHLIETEALSGLPTTEYDRIILDSATDNVIVRDGINTEYVDFGLPSRLKWAKCNVGAKKETDYGYYFQWGDIVDKSNSDCNWENYKYCNGSHNTLTKYCTDAEDDSYGTVDNKRTLEPMDDAAREYTWAVSGGCLQLLISKNCWSTQLMYGLRISMKAVWAAGSLPQRLIQVSISSFLLHLSVQSFRPTSQDPCTAFGVLRSALHSLPTLRSCTSIRTLSVLRAATPVPTVFPCVGFATNLLFSLPYRYLY